MLPASDNQWVNNPLTHLGKSTGLLRAPSNDPLSQIADHIPRMHRGVKVEYDVAYESRGHMISGYTMTDLFTRSLWLAPCNTELTIERIASIAAMHRTEDGKRIAAELTQGLEDKYLQRPIEQKGIDRLIVLPGSNLLARKVVNFKMVDDAVEAGAYIKPHPLTGVRELYALTHRYRERVLPFTGRLYPLVRAAKKVYFCTSSEVGLATMLLQKQYDILDAEDTHGPMTYRALYAGIQRSHAHRSSMRDRIISLLSYPQSGLITVYHEDYKRCVEKFFAQYVFARHGE